MRLPVKRKKVFLSLVLAATVIGYGVLTLAMPAAAAEWFRLVPECATIKGEPGKPPPVPSLVCALQTFGNISQIILGMTGSFALLMFVYGGFLLVTSGGSQEKVSKGKKTITNAVVGIIIVMCSGLLIQYGMDKLEISGSYKAIGLSCKPGEPDVTDPSGRGQYIQLPDGTLKCVVVGQCKAALKDYGFDCEDVTKEGKGKYCIANLCCSEPGAPDCARNVMCCYTPR